ncbi:hypothetical protein AAG570_005935 [Ranatra chinensis]|uniref:Uncharacterized protein n=1 Tax=Ranatra chinensis TaxID=642074 RepID=A0ABD0XZ67_9HEMI
MESKRRNMFYENEKQETTEIATLFAKVADTVSERDWNTSDGWAQSVLECDVEVQINPYSVGRKMSANKVLIAVLVTLMMVVALTLQEEICEECIPIAANVRHSLSLQEFANKLYTKSQKDGKLHVPISVVSCFMFYQNKKPETTEIVLQHILPLLQRPIVRKCILPVPIVAIVMQPPAQGPGIKSL